MKNILSLALFVTNVCIAQTTNSGSIIIDSSTKMVVQNNLVNAGSGIIKVDGELRLKKDFINNASTNGFDKADGKVTFNGGSQKIGGSHITSFPLLQLSGTGTKTLNQSIEVGNTASITKHVLNISSVQLLLSTKELTILSSSSQAIQRTTGFIVSETSSLQGCGYVNWKIGQQKNTSYLVPFGNNVTGDFLPVSLTITKAGSGINGLVRFATYPTATNTLPNNRPLPATVTNMNNTFNVDNSAQSLDRFWIIEPQQYSIDPQASMFATYRDAEWDNSGGSTNTITEPDLRLQYWDGTKWSIANGSVNTTTNQVNSDSNVLNKTFWSAAMTVNQLTQQNPSRDESLSSKVSLNVSLYPNPATNFISVNLNQTITGTWQVSVANVRGQVMLRSSFTGGTKQLDVSGLVAGTYTLALFNSNGDTHTFKFIKL
ncbi:MAG TPA: T9SS type A sorting domain-containing protein [Parafilimonas sp.]|nr:T9SS type A sorting domain-containing protein [Parafilimonas sp.]